MDSFRFQSWLWLLVIPVIAIVAWWRISKRRQPAVIFSSIADLKDLPVTLMQRIRLMFGLTDAKSLETHYRMRISDHRDRPFRHRDRRIRERDRSFR